MIRFSVYIVWSSLLRLENLNLARAHDSTWSSHKKPRDLEELDMVMIPCFDSYRCPNGNSNGNEEKEKSNVYNILISTVCTSRNVQANFF